MPKFMAVILYLCCFVAQAQDIPRFGAADIRGLAQPEERRASVPQFLLSERAVACTNHGLPVPSAAACPAGDGFRPLGNLHAAQSVFVTLQNNSDNDNSAFVNHLARILEHDAPGVTLVVLATADSWRRTPSLQGRAQVQNLPLARDADIWPQDFMEFGVTGRRQRPAVWDFHYRGRYGGDDIPQVLSHSCSEGIFRLQGTLRRSHSGNHGGNIEALAGDVVAVGSTMDASMVRSLSRMTGRQPLVIDTSWLDVGHVDELITVVPSSTAPCGFVVLHASPQRAMGIMRAHPDLPVGAPGRGMRDRIDEGAESIAQYSVQQILWNRGFSAASQLAETRIATALAQVVAAVAESTGCENVTTVALPVVFHGNERLKPLNPNPVNLIMLGDTAIVPAQFHAGFERDIRVSLHNHGVKTKFIDDRFYHFQGGNVHCATQVMRRCR